MINRNWFDLEKCKIVENDYEENDKTELNIACGNRNLRLFIYESHSYFENQENPIHINTNVFLLEKDVHIASYNYKVLLSIENNIPIEKIKFLFQEWLLEKTDLEELKLKIPELEILEIYEYYLRGKNGLEEYHLLGIRELINYNPNKPETIAIVKLFDIYTKSKVLKSLFSYTSMGVLHLQLSQEFDYCYFLYHKEKYSLFMCIDESRYYFDSAEETIAFLEKRFQNL